MFHVVNKKGDEYIIDNEGRVTAAKMSDAFWERTYYIKYDEAPVLTEDYSNIPDFLKANGNIVSFDEFYSPELKEINYSAIDIYQGKWDEINNLLESESLIDVLDNLKLLEIKHLIKYLESDEEKKSLAETANNYIEWLAYGNDAFTPDPDNYIRDFKLSMENIKISS